MSLQIQWHIRIPECSVSKYMVCLGALPWEKNTVTKVIGLYKCRRSVVWTLGILLECCFPHEALVLHSRLSESIRCLCCAQPPFTLERIFPQRWSFLLNQSNHDICPHSAWMISAHSLWHVLNKDLSEYIINPRESILYSVFRRSFNSKSSSRIQPPLCWPHQKMQGQ